MQTILIVIHLIVVLALVGVVLLQRSEGGGLGIGGGSGFMTARSAANALTRATAFLAIAFFATSLGLSLLARYGERPTDILDRVPAQTGPQVPGDTGSGGVLDQLGGSSTPAAPQGESTPSASEQQPAVPAAPTGAPSEGQGAASPSGSSQVPTTGQQAPTGAPGLTAPAPESSSGTPSAPDNSPVIPGTTSAPQAPSGQ